MRTLLGKRPHILAQNLIFALVLTCSTSKIMAQTNQPDWQRWLEHAGPIPELSVPSTRQAWETARPEMRARL